MAPCTIWIADSVTHQAIEEAFRSLRGQADICPIYRRTSSAIVRGILVDRPRRSSTTMRECWMHRSSVGARRYSIMNVMSSMTGSPATPSATWSSVS